MIVLLLLVESASLANCGDPVSSTPLEGVFHYLPLDDKCGSIYGLTTTLSDAAPLFSLQSTIRGACAWNIATVIKDDIVSIAQVDEDLFGTTVAAAPDDTYWFISDNRYVSSASDPTRTKYISPFAMGYIPTAIGSTATGEVYSIERRKAKEAENNLRLVTVADGSSIRIPLRGWNENLIRASNGRLYFRLVEHWHCHIFEVTDSGMAIDKVPCMWQNGNGIAVDNSDSIWQPSMLGISENRSGQTRSVGPVALVPCSSSNTAALEPRIVIADQRGTA